MPGRRMVSDCVPDAEPPVGMDGRSIAIPGVSPDTWLIGDLLGEPVAGSKVGLNRGLGLGIALPFQGPLRGMSCLGLS